MRRRSFLSAAVSAGKGMAAAHILRYGTSLLAPYAALVTAVGAAASPREVLVRPTEIRSRGGLLEATIVAAPDLVRLGDLSFPGLVYNGSYLPPLLRPRLGDVMRITFKNHLPDDPSNLHYHGLSVSPQGNSDNVFVHVHPGDQFEYEVHIPATGRQGPGLFWYHPHAHGVVAKQVLGGMSGGLVVEGAEHFYPILDGLPERFLFVKEAEINEREVISINGQINPAVQMCPGEMQFWRLANIGATLFIKFRIEGMALYVLGTDGHPLSQPRRLTEFFLSPGERIDAIAVGPSPGEYAVVTIPFQNEAWNKPEPSQRVATVVSSGVSSGAATSTEAVETHILGRSLSGPRWIDEVRSAVIAKRRTLAYSSTADRHAFMINGHVMDESRVDIKARLGDTEEWTVINTDRQYHSFHIHQTAFLVTEINGIRQNEASLRDTFPVPPANEHGPGMLKVVIPFTDPVILGRFMYHCHALDHEDKGMMGIIEVVA
jgi:FtsP/CotA-like multicopper oxidase with cupredoxin domain